MPVINVSEFLRALVEVLPGTVHAHVSVLLPHLSSRPYQIRQAVVVGLAEVVAAAHEDKTAASEDGENGAAKGGAASGGGNGGEDESQVQDAVWSERVVGCWRWCGPCFAYVCLALPPTGAEESWPSCVGGATRSSKPELGRVPICHRATNSVFHSRCSLEPAPAALVLRAHVASLSPRLCCVRRAHGAGSRAGSGRPSARPHERPQPRRPPRPARGARPGRLALRTVSQRRTYQKSSCLYCNPCGRVIVAAGAGRGRSKREGTTFVCISCLLPGDSASRLGVLRAPVGTPRSSPQRSSIFPPALAVCLSCSAVGPALPCPALWPSQSCRAEGLGVDCRARGASPRACSHRRSPRKRPPARPELHGQERSCQGELASRGRSPGWAVECCGLC